MYNYDYTGTVQQVTLPKRNYKLQCRGAQGGNSYSYSGVGSKGGYSEGENGKGVNKYNSVHAFTFLLLEYRTGYEILILPDYLHITVTLRMTACRHFMRY